MVCLYLHKVISYLNLKGTIFQISNALWFPWLSKMSGLYLDKLFQPYTYWMPMMLGTKVKQPMPHCLQSTMSTADELFNVAMIAFWAFTGALGW